MAHDGQLTLSTQELAVASLLRGGDGGHETLGWQASQDARHALEGRGLIHQGALAPELARAMDAIFASGLTLTAEVRIGDRVRTLRAWIEPAQAWSAVEGDASIALRELAPAQVAIWLASFVGVVRRREPWPGGEIGVEVHVLTEARETMDLRGEGEADSLLARRSGLGRPARAALLALTGEGGRRAARPGRRADQRGAGGDRAGDGDQRRCARSVAVLPAGGRGHDDPLSPSWRARGRAATCRPVRRADRATAGGGE